MDEFFDIVDVKNEFLKNVGPQYQGMYMPQQLEIAVYMLNDFCNNVAANGLILMRRAPEPEPVYEPQPYYPQPMQPVYPTPQRPPYIQQQQPPQDPFVEYQAPPQSRVSPYGQYQQPPAPRPIQQQQPPIQRQVNELNQGLQSRMPPRPPIQPPIAEADLNPEKSKTFVDKIKDMRTPKKSDKINPEE